MFSLKQAGYLKEQCEKDEKYFTIYDIYTPNYKKRMLTFKFYSKYEVVDFENVDMDIVEKIAKITTETPNMKYDWPQTENQRYGWFYQPLVEVDYKDSRFYHPNKTSDFIKHRLKLQQDEVNLPKQKFTGLPFKVQ